MREFLRQYLEPADRLGEILFGLIMALGFTAAARLGHVEADNHSLLIHIFGCNLAWGVVDGVIFVLTALFERGRRVRLAREVKAAATEEEALRRIGEELDGPLSAVTTPEERRQIHNWVLALARRETPTPPRVRRHDVLGGLAVAVVIVLATLPIVVPFLVVRRPDLAVRLSNLVATTELFLLGAWWARVVGARPLRVALGLTLVAAVLVAVTVALGG